MTAQPAVPFWLQVATVTLAPLLGFIGVAIGAWLQSRSNRRLALRTHRQSAYSDFLEAAENYHTIFAIKVASAMRDQSDTRGAHIEDVGQSKLALDKARLLVTLLGSKQTALAAEKIDFCARLYLALAAVTLQDGYKHDDWLNISDRFTAAVAKFQSAASRDLDAPRKKALKLELDEFEKLWDGRAAAAYDEWVKDFEAKKK